jgi:hypothetical protein
MRRRVQEAAEIAKEISTIPQQEEYIRSIALTVLHA